MLCISKPCHCTTLLYFGWLSALCSFNNLRDGNFWGQPEQGYWEGHSRCFRWERSLSSLPTFWPQCPQWSTSPLLKQSVRKISIYFKKTWYSLVWYFGASEVSMLCQSGTCMAIGTGSHLLHLADFGHQHQPPPPCGHHHPRSVPGDV